MLSPFRPNVLGLWSKHQKGSRLVFSNHVLTGKKNLEFGSFVRLDLRKDNCARGMWYTRLRKKTLLKLNKKCAYIRARGGSVRLETKPSW